MKLEINLSVEEYNQVKEAADKIGAFSIEEYVKIKLFGNVYGSDLIEATVELIRDLSPGTKFNIKQLYGINWNGFNTGTKRSLGKAVYKESFKEGAIYKEIGKDRSNLQWYEKV